MVSTWRATSNGLEGRAEAANSTCLILDEMGEVDAKEASATAYMLANGQGKQRATKNGDAREVKQWATMGLSSGEVTLASKLLENRGQRSKAGQSVRLLDIPSTERDFGAFDFLHGFEQPSAFSDAVSKVSAASYGLAGRAFVEFILKDIGATKLAGDAKVSEFELIALGNHPHADGQVRRAAKRFGLIAAAGELAIDAGIFPFEVGFVQDACRLGFELWLGQRGGTQSAEKFEAIERVRDAISKHGDSRFQKLEADEETRTLSFILGNNVNNRLGWYVHPVGGHEALYMFSASAWKLEIFAGLSSQRASRHLYEAGFLEVDAGNRLTKRAPRIVEGRPRIYAVKASILSGEYEAENE